MRTVWVLATIALGLIPAVARQVPDVRTPSLGPRGGERKTGWQRRLVELSIEASKLKSEKRKRQTASSTGQK